MGLPSSLVRHVALNAIPIDETVFNYERGREAVGDAPRSRIYEVRRNAANIAKLPGFCVRKANEAALALRVVLPLERVPCLPQ
jgi:hypothetical protein